MKYINYLKNKNLSKNTIKSYLSWSKKWDKYVGNSKVNKTLFVKFIKSLQAKKLNPNSIKLAYCAIKNYLSFKKEKFIYKLDVKLPSKVNVNRKIIERDFLLKKIFQLNLNNFYDKRLFTIIYILLNTGIRAFELINLKWEDFDGNKILIKGKGNKLRYVYINKEFFDYIKPLKTGYLIKSNKNKSITQKQLNTVIRDYAKQINFYFTPHDLRRSFCTHLIRNNCNLKIVQTLMGHSNISVTSRYICLTEDEILDAYNTVFK